jgi:hypothetical protein
MNHSEEKHEEPPRPEDSSPTRSQLARFARREAQLAQGLENLLAAESFDRDQFARLLAGQRSAAQGRLAWTVKWMEQLDERVTELESRLSTLTGQASNQERSVRMICSVLRDLDDPYGFGLSLDERIMSDRDEWTPEESDG